MKIGEKIRSLRTIKGYSQENVADLLGISSIAYGDIERNKTDVSYYCLEQIAMIYDMTLLELLSYGEKLSTIFNHSNHSVASRNNPITYDHDIEKSQLIIAKLTAEKEKAEIEAKYWQEKYNSVGK